MLPQPNDGFAWVQVPGGTALVCQALEPIASHFFTTRAWQLGSTPAEERDRAWADVAVAAGVPPARLVRLRQVHGATVVAVRRSGSAARDDGFPGVHPEADILVSDDGAAALTIQTADCVPLLIADRRRGAVAAAHAGWRGLAAGVPRIAVESLAREWGSTPADLVAAIGPSIGACCYEVGADVREAFRGAGFARGLERWFFDVPQPAPANPSMPALSSARRSDHWFFDGWSAAVDQLTEAGVPRGQIHVARLCTASHASLCSFRRDGAAAGRMAAVVRPDSIRP